MDKRDRRKVGGGSRKHERKNQQIPNHIYLLAIAFLLLVVVGMIFVIRRYTPTKEHMMSERLLYFDRGKSGSRYLKWRI